MVFKEFKIIHLALPQFIQNFKQSLLNYLIPSIENLIVYFQKLKVNEESPILLFLGAIILVQIITAVITATAKQKDDSGQSTEHRQLSKDLKDLKKQVKGLQKLIKEYKELNNNSSRIIKKEEREPKNQQLWLDDNSQSSQLLDLYKTSCVRGEGIAQYILDSQANILKQLKKLKKKNKTANKIDRSSSKIDKSTSKINKSSISINFSQSITKKKDQHEPQSDIKQIILQHSAIQSVAKKLLESGQKNISPRQNLIIKTSQKVLQINKTTTNFDEIQIQQSSNFSEIKSSQKNTHEDSQASTKIESFNLTQNFQKIEQANYLQQNISDIPKVQLYDQKDDEQGDQTRKTFPKNSIKKVLAPPTIRGGSFSKDSRRPPPPIRR